MILQNFDWTRFSLILITQSFVSFLFLYLAYKILKRNFSRTTLNLSGLYISSGIGFALNIIYLPLSTTKAGVLLYILYYCIIFLTLLGSSFLIIFLLNLLNVELNFTLRNQLIIMSLYALIICLMLNFPGGITINENTNWRPVWSWSFLIIIYIFITFFIIIPSLILSIKLYNTFEDDNLKKKFKYFFIGIFGLFFSLYGTALYITWDDPLFRFIWIFLSLFVVPSGLLIYYGIGHNL